MQRGEQIDGRVDRLRDSRKPAAAFFKRFVRRPGFAARHGWPLLRSAHNVL
jgi:hypothetical protein